MPENTPPTPADRFIIGIALILPTFITWIYFILLAGTPSSTQKIAFAICKVAQFALPVVWVCLVQRERLSFTRPSLWSLLTGLLFGLAVAGAMIALYFAVLLPSGLLTGPIHAVKA